MNKEEEEFYRQKAIIEWETINFSYFSLHLGSTTWSSSEQCKFIYSYFE